MKRRSHSSNNKVMCLFQPICQLWFSEGLRLCVQCIRKVGCKRLHCQEDQEIHVCMRMFISSIWKLPVRWSEHVSSLQISVFPWFKQNRELNPVNTTSEVSRGVTTLDGEMVQRVCFCWDRSVNMQLFNIPYFPDDEPLRDSARRLCAARGYGLLCVSEFALSAS